MAITKHRKLGNKNKNINNHGHYSNEIVTKTSVTAQAHR